MIDLDQYLSRHEHDRATAFESLMQRRVREILLVSSLYDSFLLAPGGLLHEQMVSEYLGLNLANPPRVTRVSNAAQALTAAAGASFDLLITTTHTGDLPVTEFARTLRTQNREMPIVLLAFDDRELQQAVRLKKDAVYDKVFLWQGDFRILLAIVKHFEDRWNAEHDSAVMGVQMILLIEDNVRFYSSYLPLFYAEVMRQSQNLISESMNLYHRLLRMRARPKILHCETFEEAWELYGRYEGNVLGIVTDIEFPLEGTLTPAAGAEFARRVKERRPDIPILLQSSDPDTARLASEMGAGFVRKESPNLLMEVRQFMTDSFGFGDFVFRLPDGTEIARASNLPQLEQQLRAVPAECLRFHGERDHFSRWLKARTEFDLAEKLRLRRVSDYATLEDLRKDAVESLHRFRRERAHGHITDFHRETFDGSAGFLRIGGGSLGGKARGLAFVHHVLAHYPAAEGFDDVEISVPPSVVLCTDVFDRFLEQNGLRHLALQSKDEELIERRFLRAELPRSVRDDLAAYLKVVRYPLAVRSSSLFEDSQFHPFAGVYLTYMLPNNHTHPAVRLAQLEAAVKRVYASLFSRRAHTYIAATTYRLEEEKMAVIVQKLVGRGHGPRFYPDIAGAARSHNFYPVPPMSPADGVASAALGFGQTVTEGEPALHFCPKYPDHVIGMSSPRDYLDYSQRSFYALDLAGSGGGGNTVPEPDLTRYDLDTAERDGTLHVVGGVYSPESETISDGLSRTGVRIVNFAPILKHKLFPLPELVSRMLELGTAGINSPVEIEFAANLSEEHGSPKEFAVVQLRPLVAGGEAANLETEDHPPEEVLCHSSQVLGAGRVDELRDIVVVDIERFDRGRSPAAAEEVAYFNRKLSAAGIPYLLVGVGRWGSADPWLGIPVTWEQISGAKVIVETGFHDFKVTPSQGAHFFQNIAALRIGYFTVDPDDGDAVLDWRWLREQPAAEERSFVRHIRLSSPLTVLMNGFRGKGVVLKPRA